MNLGVICDVELTAYIDASFGIHADLRSHTGVISTMGKGSFVSVLLRHECFGNAGMHF